MFLLRSAFWLTVMFIIIAPKDADLGKQAADASRQALSLGQQAVVEHVLKDCTSLECAGGKAALTILSAPKTSADSVAATNSSSRVPLPRPRPDRAS
jgi:hypothetical protein